MKVCNTTVFNSFNPWAHDVAQMQGRLEGGISRVGHFQFWGPNGFVYNGVNRGWGPGERDTWVGYAPGNAGALWCARFWEGGNGNWVDVSGPICVTG
ncbi:hypothetical protein BTZ20_0775 [Rhodococcus sp. MTM3W5.2]|nr:hypothetical protein BTZ20_0775 [Rhodococcus sp. MTM3W5.2]